MMGKHSMMRAAGSESACSPGRAGMIGRLLLVVLLLCVVGAASGWALSTDFKQSANNYLGYDLGSIHWTTLVIQLGNSRYYEGMSVFHRAIFDAVPATTGNVHSLAFSHHATRGGIHAYDFLTSWAQAEAEDEAALGVDVLLNQCGPEIGGIPNFQAICATLHGLYWVDVAVPDDPYLSKDGSTLAKIQAYEALFGNRTIRIYGNQPISSTLVTVCHNVAAGADTGDSYAHYVLTWTSTSTQIIVEMAGHLAVSGDGTSFSWGAGLGSSFYPTGPYHFKLDLLCGPVSGPITCPQGLSECNAPILTDNQIKAPEPVPPCPDCSVTGPYSVSPGSTNVYSVTLNGTCTIPETILWTVTDGATITGPNNGSSVTVVADSTCGSYVVTATITCGNCPDPGTSCSLTANVVDTTPPVLTCADYRIYIEEPTRASGIPTASCSLVSSVTDDCDPSPTLSQIPAAGTCVLPGAYPVTVTATDASGKSSSCTVTVTIALLSKTVPAATPGWHIIAPPHQGDHALRDAATVMMVSKDGGPPVPFCEAVLNGWLQSPLYYYDDSPTGGGYLNAGCDPWDDDSLRQGKGYWAMTYEPDLTLVFP